LVLKYQFYNPEISYLSMRISLISIFCLFFVGALWTQCDLDRHNTTLSSGWISCDISPSPNAFRGDSHWIQYDLGEPKKLGSSHFWNLSNPETLEFGVRQLSIAISMDGINWEDLAIVEAPIGEASGFYQGVPGYDFGGATARYVLLTGLNNHAGSSECVGFSEIRVQIEQSTSTEDVAGVSSAFTLFPNPANHQVTVAILDLPVSNYQMQLLDLSGKSVIEKKVQITEGQTEFIVNTQGIESGQYLLSLQNGFLVKQAKVTIIQE